jgi:hypothetical protein
MGAGSYWEVYSLIENNLLQPGDYSKLTIPTVLGVNPWYVIVPFAIIVRGILLWMDQIESKNKLTQES